jgi:prepilin-type processing-associated H-X9-DG protein
VKTLAAFVPKLKDPRDMEKFGVVVTFKRGYDAETIRKGAGQLLPMNAKVTVQSVNDRTALVLVNLGEEYGKPRPAGDTGPLSAALKAAAGGQHAVVVGVTPESLPDQLRGDDLPGPVRPFQPLLRASSLTVTLDLGKTVDLGVTVRTGTAAQAIECEKSLGALVGLVQDEVIGDALKVVEQEAAKNAAFKDLAALMKAAGEAARNAKFTTLGNESRLTASLPADLPFAGAYLAARQKVVEATAVNASANNLKQIGLAMHNYHDTHGNFPPAAACDKTGKPLLSWRVLILPYINENDLYKQFKLDEPWDSEHNKKLLAKMPKVYAVPGKTGPAGTDTHYRVFVGNGAGFDWVMGAKFQNFADGTSNTFLCITAETAVPWTKPDELEFNPDKDMSRLVGLVVNGKAQVLMCDGSVRTLAKIPARATLNALITRAGGEVIGDDFRP